MLKARMLALIKIFSSCVQLYIKACSSSAQSWQGRRSKSSWGSTCSSLWLWWSTKLEVIITHISAVILYCSIIKTCLPINLSSSCASSKSKLKTKWPRFSERKYYHMYIDSLECFCRCWNEEFHCGRAGRPPGPLAVDGLPQHHI